MIFWRYAPQAGDFVSRHPVTICEDRDRTGSLVSIRNVPGQIRLQEIPELGAGFQRTLAKRDCDAPAPT